MSFEWPIALLALLVVPAFVALYVVMQRRRAKYAVRFTNLDLLANVVDATPAWRRHVPPALYAVALAALLVALARPAVDHKTPKEEATVILVFDVSGSMTATDIDPNRLEAARSAGSKLIDELPDGFQISIVSFSNTVQTLVSPTRDKEEARAGLNRLVARGGTAMGDAIMHAIDIARPPSEDPTALVPQGTGTPAPRTATPAPKPTGKESQPTPAVMVLLSDGAQTVGQEDPIDAANVAKDQAVPIFTIALGTQTGVAEVPDNLGRIRRVQVPPDEETLKEIASITEAKFFSAPTSGELTSIYDELGSKIGYTTESTEISWLFAGVGALFVVAAGGAALAWFNRFP